VDAQAQSNLTNARSATLRRSGCMDFSVGTGGNQLSFRAAGLSIRMGIECPQLYGVNTLGLRTGLRWPLTLVRNIQTIADCPGVELVLHFNNWSVRRCGSGLAKKRSHQHCAGYSRRINDAGRGAGRSKAQTIHGDLPSAVFPVGRRRWGGGPVMVLTKSLTCLFRHSQCTQCDFGRSKLERNWARV